MADDYTVAGATFRAIDVGGKLYQAIMLDIGNSGGSIPWDGVVVLGESAAEIGSLAAGTALIGSAKTAESGRTMLHAKVALAASGTATAVLDPTAGKKFVLKKMIVSCKTAGDVYFFDDTDDSAHAIGPALTLAVGGGWTETWDSDDLYRSETADHVLKYTSGAGLTGSVYIDYFEE